MTPAEPFLSKLTRQKLVISLKMSREQIASTFAEVHSAARPGIFLLAYRNPTARFISKCSGHAAQVLDGALNLSFSALISTLREVRKGLLRKTKEMKRCAH